MEIRMRTKIVIRAVLEIDHPDGFRLLKGAVRARAERLLEAENDESQPSDFIIRTARVQKVDVD
jgi:hypothetical protein